MCVRGPDTDGVISRREEEEEGGAAPTNAEEDANKELRGAEM